CHTHINMSALATSTCKKCHNGPTPEEAPPGKIQPGDFEALLPPVSMTDLTFAEKEIPKEIEIKLLSQEYELVRFPHWKIIEKLKACTKDSNLAMYFHAQQDTLCLGCHHKSERGTKPALCSSCHSRPSITEGMYMPRLQAAYHLQCISCHKQMKVGPTGCVDCHKKKGEPEVKLSARNPQLENVRISSR
ncbi:MAG: cytochrome c3 family protein, partial [bacterium]